MAEHDPSAPALFEVSDLAAPDSTPFMDLEDPRYAYMFGFLQGDGHLAAGTGQRGRLTVEVNVRDIAILREFQQLTPYNSSITERIRSTNFSERHHSATWSMRSLEARTTINQLGIPYGRKSKKITPPRVEFSRRDYLRGVIDADGSLGYTSQGIPFISLTTASTAIGAYLCHYAKKITGSRRHIRRNTRDGIYNIFYTREAAKKLAEHLYYPGCLSLERKRSSATAVTSWKRPAGAKVQPPRLSWTPEQDRVLLAAPTMKQAAAALGCSVSACQTRRWKLINGLVPLTEDPYTW